MKRHSAKEDNDSLGRSIYPNNLCPEANSKKMAVAFKIHQRYDSMVSGKDTHRERDGFLHQNLSS